MNQQKAEKRIRWIEEGLALPFLIIPATESATQKKGIILLHGVGGNEQNLVGFSERLPDWTIICPRGPNSLSPGRYAWFDVDFSSGKPIIDPNQERESRKKLTDFIGQIQDAYAFENLFIGGFSQGAIMSYTIGLILPDSVKGVLAISGRILPEIIPAIDVHQPALQHLKIYIGHGVLDNTLNITYAREAKKYLSQSGIHPEYKEYEIGHQITSEMLEDFTRWLNQ